MRESFEYAQANAIAEGYLVARDILATCGSDQKGLIHVLHAWRTGYARPIDDATLLAIAQISIAAFAAHKRPPLPALPTTPIGKRQ